MSEVWGLLEKSLTDDETINEAINAAVAAHEADASAHLGSGESLEAHKTETIIDHLRGSILADKLTASEEVYQSHFESLDYWVQTGTITKEGLAAVWLGVEDGVSDLSRIRSVVTTDGNYLDYTKDMLFQSAFALDYEDAFKFYAGLGIYTSATNLAGFGFYFYNGDMYAFWGTGASITLSGAITVTPTALHVYRAQYDASALTVYYFIDNVQVASLTKASAPSAMEPDVFFVLDRQSVSEALVQIQNMYISRQRP